MSLPVLVVVVAVGITLVVAAVHYTGGSRPVVLASEEEAMRRFLVDFPAEKVESVRLTADRSAAFISLYGGGAGIVRAMGNRYMTRHVSPSEVKAVALAGNTVCIRWRDFTWPKAEFAFADPTEAAEIAAMLDPSLNSQAVRV